MPKLFQLQPNLVHISNAWNLYRFCNGLTSVFIPLVILKNHGTLLMVAGFYLLFSIAKFVMDFPAIRFIQRTGVHIGLSMSFIFYALQLACILSYANTHSLVFLMLGAISVALVSAFGDNARHMYIPAVMKYTGKSSSIAAIEMLGQLADLLGPLIGAVIGTLLGTDWLLIAALICLSFTIIPLAKIRKLATIDQTTRLYFSMSNAPRGDLVANFCFNVEAATSESLWPIYLAVTLGTFSEVGSVAAISAFGTIIALWTAGHRGDRGKDRSVLREGIAVMSLVNFFRCIATTIGTITAASVTYKAGQAYGLNALNATYYSHAKRRGLQYMVAMEIACDLGYLTVWGILFGVLALLDDSKIFFITGFVVAAVAIWGTLLLTPQAATLQSNEIS